MSLCKYKNIFGEPNTGLHSIRMFNLAIIDILLSILLYYYIEKYFTFTQNNYLKILLFILFIIFVHKIFCVDTFLNRLLFA